VEGPTLWPKGTISEEAVVQEGESSDPNNSNRAVTRERPS